MPWNRFATLYTHSGKQFGKESVRVKWILRSLFHSLGRDERSHARQEQCNGQEGKLKGRTGSLLSAVIPGGQGMHLEQSLHFFAWVMGSSGAGPPIVQVQEVVGYMEVLSYKGGFCNQCLQMIDEDIVCRFLRVDVNKDKEV